MIDEGEIISGKKLGELLGFEASYAKNSIVLISAYVTDPAVNFLLENLQKNQIKKSLICRASLQDILKGSTSLKSLRLLLDNHVKVFSLYNLHAKIYSFDFKNIYVASSNFTSNGLNLFGNGNLEGATKVSASSNNIKFIKMILNNAREITLEDLNKMEHYLEINNFNVGEKYYQNINEWPEDIFRPKDDLWIADLLWVNILEDPIDRCGLQHDLSILKIEECSILESNPDILENSKPIKWLISELEMTDDLTASFGYLSAKLHDKLIDDPGPYRKEVKQLLSNILSYCSKYLKYKISIIRPNYSQVVSLINH